MGKIREGVTSWPLYWPDGWERKGRFQRKRASFGKTHVYEQSQEVLAELSRMGVRPRDVVISTNLKLRQDGLPYANQRIPDDPGVAVWFTYKGQERVLACDIWDRGEHNLRAIAKHIDALRGQARWGVGSLEQAFQGFTALPESAGTGSSCWSVLEISPDSDARAIGDAFKRLAMKRHPDHGGSSEEFHALNEARKEAMAAL